MAYKYPLRLHDLQEDYRARIKDFCVKIDGTVFLVREVAASRPHYQAAIVCDIKRSAFIARLKRAFPEIKGNEAYSISAKEMHDFDGYVQYLCKGSGQGQLPDVVYHQGLEITEEWIKAKHEAYWARNAELKSKAKAGKLDMYAELKKEVADMDVSDVYELRKAAFRRYIRLCVELKKGVDAYAARRMVNLVLCEMSPQYEERMVEEMMDKY